jgi:hypothetical protein
LPNDCNDAQEMAALGGYFLSLSIALLCAGHGPAA